MKFYTTNRGEPMVGFIPPGKSWPVFCLAVPMTAGDLLEAEAVQEISVNEASEYNSSDFVYSELYISTAFPPVVGGEYAPATHAGSLYAGEFDAVMGVNATEEEHHHIVRNQGKMIAPYTGTGYVVFSITNHASSLHQITVEYYRLPTPNVYGQLQVTNFGPTT